MNKRTKRRAASKKQPRNYKVILLLVGSVTLAAAIVTVIWLGFSGSGSRRQKTAEVARGGGTSSEKEPNKGAFEPIDWKVPPGGKAVDLPIPTSALAKSQFTSRQEPPLALGPGPQYLYGRSFLPYQGQFDAETGKLTRERSLGERVMYRNSFNTGVVYTAALSAEGRAAAMRDRPSDRICVWDTTGDDPVHEIPLTPVVHTISPYGGSGPLVTAWLGWAGSTLLYLDNGRLAAYDTVAKSQKFAVGTEYRQPALLAPNGAWVVLSVADRHLEVIDTTSGACLGRLGSQGDWRDMALSPDGKRLALTRYLGDITKANTEEFSLHLADLSDGAVRRLSTTAAYGSPKWLDADRIMLHAGMMNASHTHDLTKGYDTHTLLIINPKKPETQVLVQPRSDGQLLLTHKNLNEQFWQYSTVTLDLPKGEAVFGPGTGGPVRVDVTTDQAAFNALVTDGLNQSLTRAGYTLGDGGWKIVLDGNITTGGGALKVKGQGGVLPIPVYHGTFKLVAPSGDVLLSKNSAGSFRPERSPYAHQHPDAKRETAAQSTTTYEFGPKNPFTAMLEEVAGATVRNAQTASWPPVVWKVGGKNLVLPIATSATTVPLEP